MPPRATSEGDAATDTEPVTIDREAEPRRWVCPNGHSSWERTNSHLWCPQCRRALENGRELLREAAEHWSLYDQKLDEEIAYAKVEFAGER